MSAHAPFGDQPADRVASTVVVMEKDRRSLAREHGAVSSLGTSAAKSSGVRPSTSRASSVAPSERRNVASRGGRCEARTGAVRVVTSEAAAAATAAVSSLSFVVVRPSGEAAAARATTARGSDRGRASVA